MTAVILDQEAAKFATLAGPVEVHDAAGRLLGYFTPSPVNSAAVEFSEEELEEARRDVKEGRVFSTRQVLDHLESLGSR